MTLDEAIEHEEELAKINQRVVDTGIVFDDVTIDMLYCDDTEVIEEHLANYQRCAEEHKQISEWLKELKMYREHFISAKTINDLAQFAITSTGQSDNYFLGMCNGIEYMRGVLTNTKCNFFEKTKGSEDKE